MLSFSHKMSLMRYGIQLSQFLRVFQPTLINQMHRCIPYTETFFLLNKVG